MNILLFGDVVGKPGREALKCAVPELRKKYSADLVIVNAENMAHGFGITPETIEELQGAEVDVFTSGNHIWKNAKGVEMLKENPEHVLRPANLLGNQYGRGFTHVDVDGVSVCVINLQGDVFMGEDVHSPFDTFDDIYREHCSDAITIVDLHAEATGEKRMFGWHVDGRASIVVGTHTHIQTSDEQIMPGGTAYITDLGMCGATDSSLGMDKELVKQKVIHGLNVSLEPPVDPREVVASGIAVTVDAESKKATSIERIDLKLAI